MGLRFKLFLLSLIGKPALRLRGVDPWETYRGHPENSLRHPRASRPSYNPRPGRKAVTFPSHQTSPFHLLQGFISGLSTQQGLQPAAWAGRRTLEGRGPWGGLPSVSLGLAEERRLGIFSYRPVVRRFPQGVTSLSSHQHL